MRIDVASHCSQQALVTAIEASTVSRFYSLFGRLPGAEMYEDAKLLCVISGVPNALFNGVLRSQLASDEADDKIRAVLARFERRRAPMYWYTGPSARPLDLGERLEAHGLTHVEDAPGMAVDLRALTEDPPAPTGLAIRQVRDPESLALWVRIFASPEDVDICLDVYGRLGVGPGSPFRHYVGLLDGEPVGCSSLFPAAGVATVQHVATVPQARRRGVGTAMTLAALRKGRDLGYRIGTLASTPQGVGVYRRLGFQEYCSFGVYYWSAAERPATPASDVQ